MLSRSIFAALLAVFSAGAQAQSSLGYYRSPAIHGNDVVFTSEGDLWRVNAGGGLAERLTSHPLMETNASISPDGAWVAFSAAYEGPTEAYVMPIGGGAPVRLTYGENASVVGWTPDGRVLYSSSRHSTLPDKQLFWVHPVTMLHGAIPLSEANDGVYSADGKQLFFTRFAFQGSHTKRYKGGTAQNIWRWDGGDTEAKPLTIDFTGTSSNPMWWKGRVYFQSDRDGVMNIWSMDPNGGNLKQHTFHKDYDIQSPALDAGKIVYQLGADLYLLDLATGGDGKIPIQLSSDFDQTREKWIRTPISWVTSVHLSPDGSKVVLTARGQVFIAPSKPGRIIEVTRNKNVRYRNARFSSDGKSILALSDESGEVEVWKLPGEGDGSGAPEQLTKDGTILRWEAYPSPDGKWIAHTDKNHRLFLFDNGTKTSKLIADSDVDDISDVTWSRDGKYLAYTEPAKNTFAQVRLLEVSTGTVVPVTSDRFNSGSPAFSEDGKFLYFVSDRHLSSSVSSPWGPRSPEPYFDKQTQIYAVALQPGNRSPFQPDDELADVNKTQAPPKKDGEKPELPAIELKGLSARQVAVPIEPGNYDSLTVCGGRLFFRSIVDDNASLVSVAIRNRKVKIDPVVGGILNFESTPDGKKLLANLAGRFYVFDANGAPPDPSEATVNLDGWAFSFNPKEEWQQMFDEAWRLHRDYLYAPNMQGVNWPAMKAKYKPLVSRVADRSELADVLAQMVGEVSLLHTFVYGGDRRPGTDLVEVASIGAEWTREESFGGYRIAKLYPTDPDSPETLSPASRPGVELAVGDVVTMIDGIPTLSVKDAGALLRAKGGKQVRLKIFPGGDRSKVRDIILTPYGQNQETDLQYSSWEYSRRLQVESAGKGQLGYVHLRAMGSGDIDQWARDFYPVFNRDGLIIDVRHNGGGNIDSWILEKLLRRAWMYWNQRKGQPQWNMQFAFRGKLVVLCDQSTGSDGEAFTEGFRRLGLGKVIGTRTWGGEVWLSSSNTLVDRGIATAAEFGVYGPEGKWLIEGHGVDPDIVVDNLPRATFDGKDAQLEAAIKHLLDEIAKHPNPVPPSPAYPDKSFKPRDK